MSTNSKTQSTRPAAEALKVPAAWIGLDWGHGEHAFALQEPGKPPEEDRLENTPEALHAWLGELAERYGGRPVRLALEGKGGTALPLLLEYPWLEIYPVNPVTSARYRTAFTPSGASDDLPDARVLLELVRDHAAKLRPLEAEEESTQQLLALVKTRRTLVDRRTQVVLQLDSLLKAYYPQALKLAGNLSTDMALDFLDRWPDALSLKRAKPTAIRSFYWKHNLRRPEWIQERLEHIQKTKSLLTQEVLLEVSVRHMRLLVDQLRVFKKHLPPLETEIARVFAAHPEVELFKHLPGAGPALGPRLCVAFGTLRSLYPEPAALQKYGGVAPVREKSGDQVWVHWRWMAPVFLRQTFVEWAGQTVKHSLWARTYYKQQRAKKRPRQTILRALAFKWIRVLWKCWQERTPYDEVRYIKQLIHRKSPYAPTQP